MAADPHAETIDHLVTLVGKLTDTLGAVLNQVEHLTERERELSENVAQLHLDVQAARRWSQAADIGLGEAISALDARVTNVHTEALRALNTRLHGGTTP